MGDMTMPPKPVELQQIERYVLSPDDCGQHLLAMAQAMAEEHLAAAKVPTTERDDLRDKYLGKAAETIAGFLHLAWGGNDPAECARRSYEILCNLRDRMRGMNPDDTWRYAIAAMNADIEARLRRAENFTLTTKGEKELVSRFFHNGGDADGQYAYLQDIAEAIKDFHWQRHHRPDTDEACREGHTVMVGQRGERKLEKHLERAAIEALATYIEQGNIARGMIENPIDPTIVLRDRLNLQRAIGAYSEETWAEAGRQLAEFIEERFGTKAGRKEARTARARWKSLARAHTRQVQ